APLGPFGRLLQAEPPIAISVSTANDSAHCGLRRLNVSVAPPSVSPSRSSPRPPPNPPGFGALSGAASPVQNVFTTIATCDGPPGVNVTFGGSGIQVIEGAGC